MEAKLKKKVEEMQAVRKLIHDSGFSQHALDNLCLSTAVLVLAAEFEGIKEEIKKLGNIVSPK